MTDPSAANGGTAAAVEARAAHFQALVESADVAIFSNQTGVTATVATDGKVTMTAADGRNIDIAHVGTAATATTGLAPQATFTRSPARFSRKKQSNCCDRSSRPRMKNFARRSMRFQL